MKKFSLVLEIVFYAIADGFICFTSSPEDKIFNTFAAMLLIIIFLYVKSIYIKLFSEEDDRSPN